jgi:CheY-like chemotaxis protein
MSKLGTILVVDDDDELRDMLSEVLEKRIIMLTAQADKQTVMQPFLR